MNFCNNKYLEEPGEVNVDTSWDHEIASLSSHCCGAVETSGFATDTPR